jgi:hypothetical protein
MSEDDSHEQFSLAIHSLNSPTAISDAAFIPRFSTSRDVLVIARGSLLQFGVLADRVHFSVLMEYTLFGTVVRVLPLHHPSDQQSNLLVITADRRYSILRSTASSITTVQSGNLCASTGVPIDPPFQVRVGPHAILVQLHTQVLQLFKITPQSQLSPPFNCLIPAKALVDFEFLSQSDSDARVIVLIEEFNQQARLQVYEADDATKTFAPRANWSFSVRPDTYRLQPLTDTSVVCFSTSAAYRITFHATTSTGQQSSTIYTSHPLRLFVKVDPHHLLSSDTGGNLLAVLLLQDGCVHVMRIGGVDAPVALLRIDAELALAISAAGESSAIALSGASFGTTATVRPFLPRSGVPRKILEVSANEFVGLCGGGFAQVIRESLRVRELCVVGMTGVTGVWFHGDRRVALTYGSVSAMFAVTEKGIAIVTDRRLVADDATLAFASCDGGAAFVQVTRQRVRTPRGSVDFGRILCAAVSGGRVAVVVGADGGHRAAVVSDAAAIVCSIPIPSSAEAVALSGDLLALASWANEAVFVFSLASGGLIRTIAPVKAVDLAITDAALVVLEYRDRCVFYSLAATGDVRSLHCEGLHYSLIARDDGSFFVSGERPVLIQDGVVKGFEYKAFTAGAADGDTFALVCGDRLAIVAGEEFAMAVHDDRNALNVIDAVQVGDAETFVVATEASGRVTLGVAAHPLAHPQPTVRDDGADAYVGMAAIAFDDMNFVAVVFGKRLRLFEFGNRHLEVRSNLELDAPPFAIEAFEQRLLVAFPHKIELYQPEVVSASDVRLRKISEMATQGSAACVTCDDDIVAIADELQSIVLYNFDETTNKFGENARNCFDLGMRLCRLRGDDYFAIDTAGHFYHMAIGETKNLESYDLIILASCNIGQRATALAVLPAKEPRLLIATESGQYLEVVSFAPPPRFDELYRAIETHVQSLGRFGSRAYRTVMMGNYLFPSPVVTVLDLVKMFVRLDARPQGVIAASAGMSVEEARDICGQVLACG